MFSIVLSNPFFWALILSPIILIQYAKKKGWNNISKYYVNIFIFNTFITIAGFMWSGEDVDGLYENSYRNSYVDTFNYIEGHREEVRERRSGCSGVNCTTTKIKRIDDKYNYSSLRRVNTDISGMDWRQVSQSFKNKKISSYKSSAGDSYKIVNIKPDIKIPVTDSARIMNYPRALYDLDSKGEAFNNELKRMAASGEILEYPKRQSNSAYGTKLLNGVISDMAEFPTSKMNKLLSTWSSDNGDRLDVNPIVYVTNKNQDIYPYIEANWRAGGLHDATIIVGVDNHGKVKWTKGLTYSDSKKLLDTMNSGFIGVQVGDGEFINKFTKNLEHNYIPVNPAKFDKMASDVNIPIIALLKIFTANLIFLLISFYFLGNKANSSSESKSIENIKKQNPLTFLSPHNKEVTKNLEELIDLTNSIEAKEDLPKLAKLLSEGKNYKYKNGLLKLLAVLSSPFALVWPVTVMFIFKGGMIFVLAGFVLSGGLVLIGFTRRNYVKMVSDSVKEKYSLLINDLQNNETVTLSKNLQENSAELTMGYDYKISKQIDGVWSGKETNTDYKIIDYTFSYDRGGLSGLNNLGKKSTGNAVKEVGKFAIINAIKIGSAVNSKGRHANINTIVHKTRQFILMPTDIQVPNFIIVSKTLEGLVDEPLRNNNMEYIKNGLNSSDLNKRFSVFSDNNKEFTSFMKPTVRKALLDLLKHDNDIIVQSYEGHISLGIGGKDMKEIDSGLNLDNPKELAELFESKDEQFVLLKDLGGFIETLHRMNDDNFK